jgi:hypothetical protein
MVICLPAPLAMPAIVEISSNEEKGHKSRMDIRLRVR